MIARYIIVHCDLKYPVRNLITLGAPMNGVEYEEDCINYHEIAVKDNHND